MRMSPLRLVLDLAVKGLELKIEVLDLLHSFGNQNLLDVCKSCLSVLLVLSAIQHSLSDSRNIGLRLKLCG